MTTPVRELLDEAAISDVPASLGSDVVAGARRRRRHRVIAATAGVAATAVVLAVVTPSVLQRRQVDVVQPSPGQSAVVPRLIPPLGDHLPSVYDREVDRVSVAWTTADPRPTSPDSVRLLALGLGTAALVAGSAFAVSYNETA